MVNLSQFKVNNYPDGHKHIVSTMDLHGDYTLSASIKSFDDLFLIAQVKYIHPELTHLNILYLLGTRCDRRFSPGEAIDIDIVCRFINSIGFKAITVTKPHSQRAVDILSENIKSVYPHDPTKQLLELVYKDIGYVNNGRCFGNETFAIISPDDGCWKWIREVVPLGADVLRFSKSRDVSTGAISCASNDIGRYKDKQHFIIVDDLCDGGGTFTAIAKEIKALSPQAKVYLVVTHAIFSKGVQPFEGLIDHIYCTNSFADFNYPGKVTQFNIQ